jgi:hypothetical protein
MGGKTCFKSNCFSTHKGFSIKLWLHLQQHLWCISKQKITLSYNWRLLNLQLHGFYHNDGKLIIGVREVGVV